MNQYNRYLLITFLLYSQNLLFSFMSRFVFIPSLYESLLLLAIVVIVSTVKYSKILFTLWIVLYFIHFSFISYFGEILCSSDIYLFFTHIDESFESFFYTLEMYTSAFVISMATLAVVLGFHIKSKFSILKLLILFVVAVILVNYIKINDASLLLVKALFQVSTPNYLHVEKNIKYAKEHKIVREADVNIVLIIGESMRAKEYQKESYEMFENYFYKSIYSGATSTDVSIPLLLNGAIKPSEIDTANNLFSLAKKSGYRTHFITTQSEKSMKYIKPYMSEESIDKYKVLASRVDKELLKMLEKIDINDSELDFIVMQMQGEHSPYIYYPNYEKSTITQQYSESMEYSNSVILEMLKYVQSSKRETLFIFTSDHGELIGENSRVGHNRFEEQIYRIPLIINSTCSIKLNYNKVESHNDLYQLLYYILGFSKEYKIADEKIQINGSMLNEEDGFKIMERKNENN